MDCKLYIESKKKLLELILQFIDDDSNNDESFTKLIKFIDENKIYENQGELTILFYILRNISQYHYRKQGFFEKIEKILNKYIEQIKQTFTEEELFDIFRSDKRLIYYLLQANLITKSQDIIKDLNKIDPLYFQPEIDPIKFNSLVSSGQQDYQDFEVNRQRGENPSYISQLIRDDSVEEFIKYTNKENIQLTSTINNSIFDTNVSLYKPTLIEYATFFGSIDIFQYLLNNDVPMRYLIWYCSIHGRNAQIISILEEKKVEMPEKGYVVLYQEAIKYHHNEIADYFKEKYLNKKEFNDRSCSIDSYNFFFFPSNLYNHIILNTLVSNNYLDLVKILFKNKWFEITEFMIECSKRPSQKKLLEFLLGKITFIPPFTYYNSKLTVFSSQNPNLIKIERNAFTKSRQLTTVVIPPSVKEIGVGAFAKCTNLTKIDLGNVEIIHEYAFLKCIKLESITIPSSVKKIMSCCFSGCDNLSNISCENSSIKSMIDQIGFNDDITINIVFFSSTLTFKFSNTATIEEVREKISELQQIPTFHFRLIRGFNNNLKVLRDCKHIQDYFIANNDRVQFKNAHCLAGCYPLNIDLPNGKVFMADLKFENTFLNIKNAIHFQKGYPVDQQHLFLENKELENEKHIADYNINEYSSLQLVVGSNSGDNITMHIYRIVDNRGIKCKTLDVNRNDLVSDVKIKLMNSNPNQVELKSPDDFDLLYSGKQLEKDKKITDYGIQDGAFLTIQIK